MMLYIKWSVIEGLHKKLKNEYKLRKNSPLNIKITAQRQVFNKKIQFENFKKVMWSLFDSKIDIHQLLILKDKKTIYKYEHKSNITGRPKVGSPTLIPHWVYYTTDKKEALLKVLYTEIEAYIYEQPDSNR